MTSLYSLRSTPAPGEFTILKLDEDYNVESVYALSASTCTCPQGHKPQCKHRRMLPLFEEHGHVDDGWFLDWTTRLWRHPVGGAEVLAERKLADSTLLGNAEHQEEIAWRRASGFASEASNAALNAPSTNSQVPGGGTDSQPAVNEPQAIPPSTNAAPTASAAAPGLRRRRI